MSIKPTAFGPVVNRSGAQPEGLYDIALSSGGVLRYRSKAENAGNLHHGKLWTDNLRFTSSVAVECVGFMIHVFDPEESHGMIYDECSHAVVRAVITGILL